MKLKQLQHTFAESLRYQHQDIVESILETNSISAEQRLQVYRNSFVMSVTEALAITYQHTYALVGDAFFNSVSRAFILAQPPSQNNIIEYGAGFSEFLAQLPQLVEMPYLFEMARFEWLLEQTSNLPIDTQQLDVSALAQLAEDKFEQLHFQTPSQLTLFHSEQDISHLYKMLIDDTLTETDLNKACNLALIKQPDFRVELLSLTNEQFQLLQQLRNGNTLAEITPTNLHQYLPQLLTQNLLNGFTIK